LTNKEKGKPFWKKQKEKGKKPENKTATKNRSQNNNHSSKCVTIRDYTSDC
jgi:hypothetical protein